MPFDEKYINKNEIRCKECFSKIKNEIDKKYRFYLCPISKDAICEECYKKNNTYEVNYPFNLLYISCKNQNFFENLPKDNILVFRDKIQYEKHPEILDEICDICSDPLCNNDIINDNNRVNCFYVIVNIIRKNNILICNNCFELLIDEKRNWYFNNKYSYINDLILNNFIDLDNLIFKKVNYN